MERINRDLKFRKQTANLKVNQDAISHKESFEERENLPNQSGDRQSPTSKTVARWEVQETASDCPENSTDTTTRSQLQIAADRDTIEATSRAQRWTDETSSRNLSTANVSADDFTDQRTQRDSRDQPTEAKATQGATHRRQTEELHRQLCQQHRKLGEWQTKLRRNELAGSRRRNFHCQTTQKLSKPEGRGAPNSLQMLKQLQSSDKPILWFWI